MTLCYLNSLSTFDFNFRNNNNLYNDYYEPLAYFFWFSVNLTEVRSA